MFFGEEATNLRNRWKNQAIDLDFKESPFGRTKEGLLDFRGVITEGTVRTPLKIEKQRIEKCDFSFARFIHCIFEDCKFLDCNLFAVDAHKCDMPGTLRHNCNRELLIYHQRPDLSEKNFKRSFRNLTSSMPPKSVKLTRLDLMKPNDFTRAIIVYINSDSIPCFSSAYVLFEILSQSTSTPKVFVLNHDDYLCCSENEQQLLRVLFGRKPRGLAEVSWVIDRKVFASDALANTCIRDTVAERLKRFGNVDIPKKPLAQEREFWSLVEKALPSGDEYSLEAHTTLLRKVLEELKPKQRGEFLRMVEELKSQAYTYELANAASVIGTGCDDDSLMDFRASLVLRGREVFYSAIANPEETLLHLKDAPLLLEEGLDYVILKLYETADSISRMTEDSMVSTNATLGGTLVDDDPEPLKALYPTLYDKYWRDNP